jgi:hypothetical protein
MLRDRGIINHKSMPVAVDACEVAIANFKQYLSQERGLSVSIQCNYTRCCPVLDAVRHRCHGICSTSRSQRQRAYCATHRRFATSISAIPTISGRDYD